MTFTPENIFFLGAVLVFASIVISKWGYRCVFRNLFDNAVVLHGGIVFNKIR